jgi:hypothetical protein
VNLELSIAAHLIRGAFYQRRPGFAAHLIRGAFYFRRPGNLFRLRTITSDPVRATDVGLWHHAHFNERAIFRCTECGLFGFAGTFVVCLL